MNGSNIIMGELMESRSADWEEMQTILQEDNNMKIISYHHYGKVIIIIVSGHTINTDKLRDYVPAEYALRGCEKYLGCGVWQLKFTRGAD